MTNFILMADVINSSEKDALQTFFEFNRITEHINSTQPDRLLSPITITLGDEFQCITKSLGDSMEVIFGLEEILIQRQADFKLRYVLYEGVISTPINTQIAHGMLGEGLTEARKILIEMKKSKDRFQIQVKPESLNNALNSSFLIYQSLLDDWNKKRHYATVTAFLQSQDYKDVAIVTGKTRSQAWKLRKSLKINEYIAIKEIIHYISS